MKTFDELFNEAALVADRREKVFNSLIERTKNEILPKFCEVCSNFDIKTVFFKTDNRLIPDSEKQKGPEDFFFSIAVNVKDKTIVDAKYDFRRESYFVPEYWTPEKITDITFFRTGIVEFVKLLNSRLENYIKKYSEKNDLAETL